VRIKALEKRGWGRFRGNGELLVSDEGIRIRGGHVHSNAAQIGIGVLLFVVLALPIFGLLAILSGPAAAVIPGYPIVCVVVYSLVERVLLKKEDIFVPWLAVKGFAPDPRNQFVGFSFESNPSASPIVSRSSSWPEIVRIFKARIPDRDVTPGVEIDR